jgi:hypothetical protein
MGCIVPKWSRSLCVRGRLLTLYNCRMGGQSYALRANMRGELELGKLQHRHIYPGKWGPGYLALPSHSRQTNIHEDVVVA